MTKIMIATDLHGSYYWTKQIVDKFHATKSDYLVLLGDIYNHGPRNPLPQEYQPQQVAELLNSLSDKLIVIKGNCDSEVDTMISNFDFLQHNVLLLKDRKVFLTHGHIFNKNNLPVLNSGDMLIYGHFHISEIVDKDGVIVVNVGSASLPKDGQHAYALLDDKGIAVYNFDDKLLCSHINK